MRNLIVLGSGRSGTSLMAGLFRSVPSVFYGYEVLRPTVSNPRGYYEDEVVNAINNILLRQMTGTALLDIVPRSILPWIEERFSWMHRDSRSLWIARPRRRLPWRLGYEIAHLMGKVCSHQPFCFKDPRFSFTLPLWQPYLPQGVRFVVVFRDPRQTVQSMLRDATELYERPLALTESWAYEHWELAYESILALRKASEAPRDWLFVHFEDLLSGAVFPAVEAFAECEIDPKEIDVTLVRSSSEGARIESAACADLYARLLSVAAGDRER